MNPFGGMATRPSAADLPLYRATTRGTSKSHAMGASCQSRCQPSRWLAGLLHGDNSIGRTQQPDVSERIPVPPSGLNGESAVEAFCTAPLDQCRLAWRRTEYAGNAPADARSVPEPLAPCSAFRCMARWQCCYAVAVQTGFCPG